MELFSCACLITADYHDALLALLAVAHLCEMALISGIFPCMICISADSWSGTSRKGLGVEMSKPSSCLKLFISKISLAPSPLKIKGWPPKQGSL